MATFPPHLRVNTPPVVPCSSLGKDVHAKFDALVIVSPQIPTGLAVQPTLQKLSEIDSCLNKEGCVTICTEAPGNRLVYAPTGPTDGDYDDVRLYAEAAKKGMKRAIGAGAKAPLLLMDGGCQFPNRDLVAVLGALEQLYEPLSYREAVKKTGTVNLIGLYGENEAEARRIAELAVKLSNGLLVARDIGGGDPERMAPPNVASYVKDIFQGSCVNVDVIADTAKLESEFPLFAAVNRAASVIERHRGCVIILTYDGETLNDDKRNIYLVGKGITYDTGGADIKAGGIMAGMSRDKCGAAAVAGFFQVLRTLQPKNIRVVGLLCVARNSVGENCYVSDEIITSRAGLRIRIGNTDAEGRMVMTDPLCWAKEDAMKHKNSHLMTIATLTGHACLALGPYSAVVDNGPARKENFSLKIQKIGEQMGDMMDISSLRREDIKFSKSTGVGEDLLQCNNAASSRTPRGHQFPMAFMMEAAGVDKFGSNTSSPLKYTHFDIAGAAGELPDTPTGVPILALSKYFFGDQFQF